MKKLKKGLNHKTIRLTATINSALENYHQKHWIKAILASGLNVLCKYEAPKATQITETLFKGHADINTSSCQDW